MEDYTKRYNVRWQDGTYDPYKDNYKEVVTKGSYWSWVELHAPKDNESGMHIEPVRADQDGLEELPSFGPSVTPEEDALIKKAYRHLTKKQQEVWDLIMRQGVSEYQASEALGISRSAIQDRIGGARARFTLAIEKLRRGESL